MEHSHMRHIPGTGKLHRSDARQPVMTMNNIIASPLATSKFFDITRECGGIVMEVIFVNRRPGSGFYMDYPYAAIQRHNLRGAFVGPAGKDINVDSVLSQFLCQLAHIDIHTTSIFCAPWRVQWRRMDTEHGDRIRHVEATPLLQLSSNIHYRCEASALRQQTAYAQSSRFLLSCSS